VNKAASSCLENHSLIAMHSLPSATITTAMHRLSLKLMQFLIHISCGRQAFEMGRVCGWLCVRGCNEGKGSVILCLTKCFALTALGCIIVVDWIAAELCVYHFRFSFYLNCYCFELLNRFWSEPYWTLKLFDGSLICFCSISRGVLLFCHNPLCVSSLGREIFCLRTLKLIATSEPFFNVFQFAVKFFLSLACQK
jgi:hypothetical protein